MYIVDISWIIMNDDIYLPVVYINVSWNWSDIFALNWIKMCGEKNKIVPSIFFFF
jgi:hypothetical protein